MIGARRLVHSDFGGLANDRPSALANAWTAAKAVSSGRLFSVVNYSEASTHVAPSGRLGKKSRRALPVDSDTILSRLTPRSAATRSIV